MKAIAVLAAVIAGPALAQTPTDVSPVTVMPRTAQPKVTATYPAAGAEIAPGILVVKIGFDQAMLKTGYDVTSTSPDKAECLKTPRLLDDRKTFVLLCRVQAGKTYALAFNAAGKGGFANEADNRAEPATLNFTTSTSEPTWSMAAAMKLADLRPVDSPIQENPDVPAPAAAP